MTSPPPYEHEIRTAGTFRGADPHETNQAAAGGVIMLRSHNFKKNVITTFREPGQSRKSVKFRLIRMLMMTESL